MWGQALAANLTACFVWYLGRRRVRWFWWDFCVPAAAVLFGLLLSHFPLMPKSLGNAFLEPLIISAVAGFTPLIRIFWPGKTEFGRLVSSAISGICPILFAVLLSLFFPGLPE
jgi:hypothetical protein